MKMFQFSGNQKLTITSSPWSLTLLRSFWLFQNWKFQVQMDLHPPKQICSIFNFSIGFSTGFPKDMPLSIFCFPQCWPRACIHPNGIGPCFYCAHHAFSPFSEKPTLLLVFAILLLYFCIHVIPIIPAVLVIPMAATTSYADWSIT